MKGQSLTSAQGTLRGSWTGCALKPEAKNMQFAALSRLIKRSFNVVKIRLPWDYQLKLSQGCELKQRHVSYPGILLLNSIWMDQEAEQRKEAAVLGRERAKACHKNGLIWADTAAWSPPSSLAPGSAAAQKSFAHPSTRFTETRLFTWPTIVDAYRVCGCCYTTTDV